MLIGAGFAAGLAGTIAGLASLFSYPALLAAGLGPTGANVTNTVSLALGSITVVHSSRRELAGQRARMTQLAVTCAFGSAVGAALLLLTPPGVFERIVPFLVGGASVLVLARRRQPEETERSSRVPYSSRLAPLGVFVVSIYGGYFAAASGVLMFALLLAMLPESLLRVNALKNVLMVVADVIAAAGFVLFAHVSWGHALPLTIGLIIGSWLGPVVARLLPARLLQIGIGLAGIGLAVKLGVDAY